MFRNLRSRLTTGAALALVAAGIGVAATSAFAGTSSGSTTANVVVNDTITLRSLTPSFTLTGDPTATVASASAVSMNVLTNSITGYNVTVQAAAAQLSGTGSNTQTIPIAALGVKGDLLNGVPVTAYTPVNNAAAVAVHSQLGASAGTGDAITNGYQITIPNVRADTYSVTLNYLASTNT